jgi:transcriptional regulator with XRE-family HTH domain
MTDLTGDQQRWIATQVRRARKSNDWTGEQLASRAGVAGGTIVRIENGRPVRPGNLRAVLDALGMTDLLEPPEEMDNGVQLALDLVQKWLTAIEDPAERDRAVQELTRFVVLRDRGPLG